MARKTGLGRGLGAIFGTDVVESVEESLHQPEKKEENHVSRETSGRKTVHTAGQTVHKKHENTGNALSTGQTEKTAKTEKKTTPADKKAAEQEENPLGCQILNQLKENLDIAGAEQIPICQDTGMAVVFAEIGQDVHIEGGSLTDAINKGVHDGYVEGYLRKSVVNDPFIRENTKDNTPAVIHYSIVPGENIKLTVAPKGFGSENMSRVFMLKPADGMEGAVNAIVSAVREAGPNACPPVVVGVGIGGTFEKAALMAKQALTRPVGTHSEFPSIKAMEEEVLEKVNNLGIGAAGLGGTVTALAVNINTYPTHIAGLPVAVNMCCHVNRHAVRTL